MLTLGAGGAGEADGELVQGPGLVAQPDLEHRGAATTTTTTTSSSSFEPISSCPSPPLAVLGAEAEGEGAEGGLLVAGGDLEAVEGEVGGGGGGGHSLRRRPEFGILLQSLLARIRFPLSRAVFVLAPCWGGGSPSFSVGSGSPKVTNAGGWGFYKKKC